MNILIPDSWLREYLKTSATPLQIQSALSLCGSSVEHLIEHSGDWIYDIEVTTNRVDSLSVFGIAREAAAILPQFGFPTKLLSDPFRDPKLKLKTSVEYLSVKLEPGLCSQFSALLIRNVKIKPSPVEIIKKLEAVGMRGLNNIVDVSNLLMHELGQPIHTFDYDKISGQKLHLHLSRKGDTITTLDSQTHNLPGGDIVLSDASGKLIDLCGIMGGLNSAVDSQTKNILLFVQSYDPLRIRRTSMSTGVRTQAAVLFEKSLPVQSVLPTLSAAAKLISHLSGGQAESTVLNLVSPTTPANVISLSTPLTKFAKDRLGIPLTSAQVATILKNLGFKISHDLVVTVPWYRAVDITIPEDLVEEIARIYGYHHLPSQLMSGAIPLSRPLDKIFNWETQIKSALKNWGFTETYTYSLTPDGDGLKIKNPLSSEWAFLRTNLTSSHISIISENIGRVPELNFFEIANVYLPRSASLPEETSHLIISTTNLNRRHLQGILDGLSQQLGTTLPPNIISYSNPACLIFESELPTVLAHASSIKKFTPISKFAPVIEDFNLNYSGNYADLVTKIKSLSPLIKHLELIDIYQHRLTLRITFHSDERQLSKDDIAPLRNLL